MEATSLYKTVIRLGILYGKETWTVRKAAQVARRTEMTILRWLVVIPRIEKIRNDEIRGRRGKH